MPLGKRGNEIELQHREIVQILFRQEFAVEMGVDEPYASKPRPAYTFRCEWRYGEPMIIADDDVFDKTPSVDEQTDLPRNLPRQVHYLFCKIKGDNR